MIARRRTRHSVETRARRGFSLLEVTISTLLVGTILTGALATVGSVVRQRRQGVDELRGILLAEQLLTEILTQAYVEPDELPLFGAELSEVLDRSKFDDVDDYHLWNDSPPRNRQGQTLPGLTGWSRTVTVELVDPDNPSITSLTDRGAKRITVEVRRDAQPVAQLRGLKTDAE